MRSLLLIAWVGVLAMASATGGTPVVPVGCATGGTPVVPVGSATGGTPVVPVGSATGGTPVVPVGGEIPFSAMRLRKPHTDRPEVWRGLVDAFAKHRAGVDEVWFSTGICFPKMDGHRASAKRLAACAEDLRKLGILPSLQVQATIGHGDAFTAHQDNTGITWQTYVAQDGSSAKSLNCPRAPGFLAYMREMSALYAAAVKPYAVWIDDDIRIINHHKSGGGSGWGCHCAGCLAEFAKTEGKARTRVQLLTEMKTNPALAARWRAFAFAGEAAIVRTIAEAVHAASPTTRMCQQQPGSCFPEHRQLYDACHQVTGLPVGMRPGAGSYYDKDPCDQIDKAYTLALQIDTIGRPAYMDRICPEIESCPRSFRCRTGRGVALEALENLAQGMNSISSLIMDAGFETPAWYGDHLIAPLARNASMLKRLAKLGEGTRRAGYAIVHKPSGELQVSSLPLYAALPGTKFELPRLLDGAKAKNIVGQGKDVLRMVFAQDMVLDGDAAEVFLKAGMGEELGIAAVTRLSGHARDRFTDDPINAGLLARETPVAGSAWVLVPRNSRVPAQYYSDGDANYHPGASLVLHETKDGKRRAIFGYSAWGSGLALASGDRLRQLHRVCDWVAHGKTPVVLDTPLRAYVQPLVKANGEFAVCTIVNATIDATDPIRIKVRGVPAAAKVAVWSALDAKDVRLDFTRGPDGAEVVLPPLSAWNGGYLHFE